MRIEKFRAGIWRQQYNYRSFSPVPLNEEWTWDSAQIHTLLADGSQWLGELKAFCEFLPDVDLYIRMHGLKEATASSRIEGTQAEIDTAALAEVDVNPEHRNDWHEIHNYVRAMNHAVDRLPALPLSNRLLLEAHKILLCGVRGKHKTPGEFRRSQNWIDGTSLADAAFIPPSPEEVPALMSDLEKFWHNDRVQVPHLVRIALSHYQFETIHPFLDGNGRIGRLLVTLYLLNFGLLSKPCFYISAFLEKHRASYYDALTAVRTRHDLTHWVKFFLNAVIATAKLAVCTFRELRQFRERMQQFIRQQGARAGNAERVLHLFYSRPFLQAPHIARELHLSPPTVNTLLEQFVSGGILVETTGFRRNRLFHFKSYMDHFRKPVA